MESFGSTIIDSTIRAVRSSVVRSVKFVMGWSSRFIVTEKVRLAARRADTSGRGQENLVSVATGAQFTCTYPK